MISNSFKTCELQCSILSCGLRTDSRAMSRPRPDVEATGHHSQGSLDSATYKPSIQLSISLDSQPSSQLGLLAPEPRNRKLWQGSAARAKSSRGQRHG